MCIAAQGEKFMGIDCSREPWEKFIPNVACKSRFLRIINAHLYSYFLKQNCVNETTAVIRGIGLFAKEYASVWIYGGEE